MKKGHGIHALFGGFRLWVSGRGENQGHVAAGALGGRRGRGNREGGNGAVGAHLDAQVAGCTAHDRSADVRGDVGHRDGEIGGIASNGDRAVHRVGDGRTADRQGAGDGLGVDQDVVQAAGTVAALAVVDLLGLGADGGQVAGELAAVGGAVGRARQGQSPADQDGADGNNGNELDQGETGLTSLDFEVFHHLEAFC